VTNKMPRWLLVVFFLATPAWPADPLPKLSSTGLFRDISQKLISDSALPYVPQYPLWSDGARKRRWIFLPEHSQINTGKASGPTSSARGNIDYWVFPVGTKFWKEFSFPDKNNSGSWRRIETRLLEKTGTTTWNYATYLWNDDESEAELASTDGAKNFYPSAAGFTHDIPSRAECTQCHNKGGDAPLGFDALQLSSDRDPRAPHAEPTTPDDITLASLVDRGLVTYVAPSLVHSPPKIISNTDEGRAAMGYFHANCGNCHNPTGPAGFTYLLFRYPLLNGGATTEATSPVFTSAINKTCYQFRIPGQTECYRIKPGDVADSSVVVRMKDPVAGPQHRMPPLGTKIPDADAIALIEEWVRKLGS
jgi:hypothetical protein